MDELTRELRRREFLRLVGALGATAGIGAFLAACGATGASSAPADSGREAPPASAGASVASVASATPGPTGTFNWLTWGDHWYQAEMDKIAADIGIKANITSFSDDIDAYTKVQQVGGQVDLVSGDALWVPTSTRPTDRPVRHQFAEGVEPAVLGCPRILDLDQPGRLPRLSERLGADPDHLRPGPRDARAPTRGSSCWTRSTRSGSSSRTSRSRSWPTWARPPASRIPTT